MSEEELRKIAKEEISKSIMDNLDSALIFTYITNLEKENQKLKENSISKDKIKDKIKELEEEVEEGYLADDNVRVNKAIIEVLKELLEE